MLGRKAITPSRKFTSHVALSPAVVRVAYDVGTLDSVTWTVATVHNEERLIRKQIQHDRMTMPNWSSAISGNHITDEGIRTLEHCFRHITGRFANARVRPRESAAIVTGDLGKADNAEEVFNALSKTFLIRFVIPQGMELEHYAHMGYVAAGGISMKYADNAVIWSEIDDRVVFFRHRRCRAAQENTLSTTSALDAVHYNDSSSETYRADTWDTGYTADEINSMILQYYQNRRLMIPGASSRRPQSVNPMNHTEAKQCLHDLVEALKESVPRWLRKARERHSVDRMFCGASGNGGTLNLLARCAGRTDIHEHMLATVFYTQYVGMTDEWLARSFPQPHMVMPRLILGQALMRSLDLRSIRYLPEISPTFGVLLDNNLYSEAAGLDHVAGDPTYPPEGHTFVAPWRTRSATMPHIDPRLPNRKSQSVLCEPISGVMD